MNFVNQVDFKAATRRSVLDVIQQVTGVFNLGARSGVYLNQVNKATLFDFPAVIAHAARRGGNPGFTIQPFRQQAGDRGFPHPAGAGKEIRMMNAAQRQTISQRGQYVLLADNISKSLWAPFAG
ncbi:hypothetical protein HMPREF0201_03388 [Cedecea davisae DSM 4568]|uniref:Uncharacterized protein n=1 Tax=Cedecea davisae DSM 4568 TaxID=566551 RepID=S3J5Y9_9ENTR|nr:hypothetical protein HMPREF0201_03388 [Cedecea davisae DSM 4568]